MKIVSIVGVMTCLLLAIVFFKIQKPFDTEIQNDASAFIHAFYYNAQNMGHNSNLIEAHFKFIKKQQFPVIEGHNIVSRNKTRQGHVILLVDGDDLRFLTMMQTLSKRYAIPITIVIANKPLADTPRLVSQMRAMQFTPILKMSIDNEQAVLTAKSMNDETVRFKNIMGRRPVALFIDIQKAFRTSKSILEKYDFSPVFYPDDAPSMMQSGSRQDIRYITMTEDYLNSDAMQYFMNALPLQIRNLSAQKTIVGKDFNLISWGFNIDMPFGFSQDLIECIDNGGGELMIDTVDGRIQLTTKYIDQDQPHDHVICTIPELDKNLNKTGRYAIKRFNEPLG